MVFSSVAIRIAFALASCCGLNYSPDLGPASTVLDSASSLEAAARRYHERKKREEAVTVVSDFIKHDDSMQGIQETTEEVPGAVEMNSRRGSFGDL